MNTIDGLIAGLRTTRRDEFSDRNVEAGLVREIIGKAVRSANASNRQSYSVIITGREKTKELNLPGSTAAVFCVDFLRLDEAARLTGREYDTSYLSQFITAVCDVSILAQTSLILAQAEGLDTQITNSLYLSDVRKSARILNLPEKKVFPVLALCLGYSDSVRKKKKGRLDCEITIHENEYRGLSSSETEKLIDFYDRDDMQLNDAWKTAGYRHYLDWFFDKWTPAIGTRKNSGILEEWLEKNGLI